jgi:(E)-4-hydroxy-3-methylbut-2-enyl-diphosphate synthase
LDVSIIGCVVNGPGEAEISDLGLTGARNMSGYYLDGKRQRERISNDDLVDQLEKRIRAKAAVKAAMQDNDKRIDIQDLSDSIESLK